MPENKVFRILLIILLAIAGTLGIAAAVTKVVNR